MYFLGIHPERLVKTMKSTVRIVITLPKFDPSIYPNQNYRYSETGSLCDLL
jgi:hypothetical protein